MIGTIDDFFKQSSLLQSRYLGDFGKIRRYGDYLDHDQNLLRDKTVRNPSGLRNIGNTCYLNAILQLLYNVNHLRNKILAIQPTQSKFLLELRLLFGAMSIGRLAFADPSNLFEELKRKRPEVFVAGVQNDFHEIFTLLLEELASDFKQQEPNEIKSIEKLFLGKLNMKIVCPEESSLRNSRFNIVNLESFHGSFDKALSAWSQSTIEDYLTAKGSKVNARIENGFVETPALMTFLINRVSFKNGQLHKDSSPFEFNEQILIPKLTINDSAKKAAIIELEAQLTHEKLVLETWISKVQESKRALEITLKYLKAKDVPAIEQPTIINPQGQIHSKTVLAYICSEIQAITAKVKQSEEECLRLAKRIEQTCEDSSSQRYFLLAVMIHQGSSAASGHYKLCIRSQDHWLEYNDRKVSPLASIDTYKQKGQVCCLFYKRNSLACDTTSILIPVRLKSTVSLKQKQTIARIDEARLLQSLHQQAESAKALLDYHLSEGPSRPYAYFLSTIAFCLKEKFEQETCRSVITYDLVKGPHFQAKLISKFISPDSAISIPVLHFGIPDQYELISSTLKNFLDLQSSTLGSIGKAFQMLVNLKFTTRWPTISKQYTEIIQIIIMKGLFYLALFSEARGPTALEIHHQLSTALDKLLQSLDCDCEFVLVYVPIKGSIDLNKQGATRMLDMRIKQPIQSHLDYFSEHFKVWIEQRRVLSKMDEGSFWRCRELFRNFESKQPT